MINYLPIGFKLKLNRGTYIIEKVIGHGGTCVAYSAFCDGQYCIVKEFLPEKYRIKRDNNGFPIFEDSEIEEYRNELERFLQSADIQKSIRNNIETQNNTPYIIDVSEAGYICVTSQSGDMFDKLFKRLSYIERLKVCLATAKLIKEYHSNGYLCLDIKPSNIFILNMVIPLTHHK